MVVDVVERYAHGGMWNVLVDGRVVGTVRKDWSGWHSFPEVSVKPIPLVSRRHKSREQAVGRLVSGWERGC